MGISEEQLEVWSHQGSIAQSKATYDTIRSVLNDPGSPYYKYNFDVFLQGSYGNSTNVWADSDVDIVIRLTSIYYYNSSQLDDQEKINFEAESSPGGGYTFWQFRTDVLQWLRAKFGGEVKDGKKAIFIPGNGTRRDADVLVCVDHRHYWSHKTVSTPVYSEGICFWTSDFQKTVNYPKQHSENCTEKHQATSAKFKTNVRVLKNMRNRMVEKKLIEPGLAPSYFLEGMLWNVPNSKFVQSFSGTFVNYMDWLSTCDQEKLECANGIHWLLREGVGVCWNPAAFSTFRKEAIKFWNSGG